jgi:integrase
VLWRLVDRNVLDAVKAPPVPRRKPAVLSADEANAYLDAFAGSPLEATILVAIGAGLRRSELAALSWKDTDLRAGTVSVTKGRHQRQGDVWIEPPKSQASRRVVALPQRCVDRLTRIRGVGPLAVENGVWMSPELISRRYKTTLADAGLTYLPLKNLRHTSATLALQAGASLYAVSKRLGHSSPAVTDAFYLSPDRSLDEDAARRLDRALERVPKCAETV